MPLFFDRGRPFSARLIRCESTFVQTIASAHIGWEYSMYEEKYLRKRSIQPHHYLEGKVLVQGR